MKLMGDSLLKSVTDERVGVLLINRSGFSVLKECEGVFYMQHEYIYYDWNFAADIILISPEGMRYAKEVEK